MAFYQWTTFRGSYDALSNSTCPIAQSYHDGHDTTCQEHNAP
jgi:hypothetical protein